MLEAVGNLERSSGLSGGTSASRSRGAVPSSGAGSSLEAHTDTPADSTERTRQAGRAVLAASRLGTESKSALSRLSASVNRRFNKSQPDNKPASTGGVDSQGFIKPLPAADPDDRAGASGKAAADPPPTSALTSEAARSERARIGLAAVAASSRASASRRANVVQGRSSLSALRDTSSSVRQFSSGVERADGGRRSTSLFDLPSSGQGLVARLRAQVRPSSPLNGLRGETESSGILARSRSGSGSLSAANAQRAGLRSAFHNADNGSRLLLSASTPSRSPGGFGVAAPKRSAFDLIG